MSADQLIAVGTVVKPHGLSGEVAVELLTDFPERFAGGLALTLREPSGALRPARIASVRPHAGRVLVRFEGVEDANAAEALRGLDLCVDAGETAARPPGFVFHYELEGCRAVDRRGNELGVVRELLDAGGLPLLALTTPRGERDVPFTAPIVVSVDAEKKLVVLDPPKGLLD
ncbi:MAG TPA: ribosome maturation factor RimM [Thermoanaerobaculia bacterium]|nr:ribosome maturation factor RimM [Thermoanaerobaculia bacterium]